MQSWFLTVNAKIEMRGNFDFLLTRYQFYASLNLFRPKVRGLSGSQQIITTTTLEEQQCQTPL